jgi:hypothetical protein
MQRQHLLTLTTSNRKFKVEQFKQGTAACNFNNPALGNYFSEPAADVGKLLTKHTMTALQVGCYKVNLVFADAVRVDPHIIVRQPAPTAVPHDKTPE